ncbi:unnamed protein product [Chironomus riparius]|uniref:Odorant receptor n=1 Tax=Chironomus riparius TaxID=315576 RepID=A0A9N9RUE5_9DIPT|nr:unnamed protein product [Chironomus riparius]
MDSYFNLIVRFSNFMGYDISNKFQSNPIIRIVLLIYKTLVFILLLLVVLQSFSNAFMKSFKTFNDLKSAMSAIFGIRGLLMNIYLIINFNKCAKLMERMKKSDILTKEHEKNQALFKTAKRVGLSIFICNIVSIWSYSIGGYIEIIKSLFTGQQPNPEVVFIYEIFWPFDPSDYLPWTLYWFSFALHYWQWSCVLVNFVILYITVYLTGSFNNLQTELEEIINGSDIRSVNGTKDMIRNFIDRHNEATRYAEELKSLAGFPIIIFIGEASLMICFLGFSVLVADASMMMISIIALCNHLVDIFIIFWASDILKESSLGIMDTISLSSYYKLDKTLKKQLILIMIAAKKPKKLSGLGFFDLELEKYTTDHDRNQKLFKNGKNMAIYVFVANIISTWTYSISGYIEIISCLFTGRDPNPALVFTYELYWPFNPSNYLPWTLFWFSFASIYWIWSSGLVNLVILYISVYITGCFNNLQAEIIEIVNGCESRSASDTRKMFKHFIDRHNEITSCMDDLISFAGFPIIIFIGQASIMICFLGMYAIMGDISILFVSGIGMVMHLLDIFTVFWAGDILNESTLGVMDAIGSSDFYKLDNCFKKQLILILKMATKPKKLSGLGFFELELEKFTTVISSAYSYFTLIKQFY